MESYKPTSHPESDRFLEVACVLTALNEALNDGRGISAVRDIIGALNRHDADCAEAIVRNEWDKLCTYPDVA